MRQQLDTAIRLSLAGQVRNRFAWILLIAFIPFWYLLSGSMFAHTGVRFLLPATGTTLVVDGHNIGLISTGLNSICLLTGFVVFTAVRRSRSFDRRLVLSGYRPAALIAAKTSGALVQAIAIGAYAAAVMLVFWRPPEVWTIALAFMLGAATYAALGLLLGVLVRGDLEGFFLIIMISIMDTFLQDPMDNPLANKPILKFFPSYAPTQFAAAGAFHHQALAGMAAMSLAWTVGLALLGLVVLRLRMPQPARSTGTPSTGTPSTGTHQRTKKAAVAQASGGPGRNPGQCGLTADQHVAPPPAAQGRPVGRKRVMAPAVAISPVRPGRGGAYGTPGEPR